MTSYKIEENRRRLRLLVVCALAVLGGCTEAPTQPDELKIERAETIVSTFYSWDAIALESTLEPGEDTESLLYYQGWAQAAHYVIENRRPCSQTSDTRVECAITVTDDFGSTLGYTATDTFGFEFTGDRVTQIEFEGDDPAVFLALFIWMKVFRTDVFEGPCMNMFEGGTTPAECARAVAMAAKDFVAWSPFN